MSSGPGGVEVRLAGLRRRYGSVLALDGLDLTLGPGELVALLGPSGCGKTTALRLLAGLEQAEEGRVLIDGRDVTALGAHRRDVGMVFQAYSLFPHLTVEQNVRFGLFLRQVKDAEARRRAGEMLDLVGLSAEAGRYPQQLSGGQQQRVALARALAIQPKVLLLDEPLSALDAQVRARLRDEIRRIQLDVGTTTLFVTHDQEEALAVADRVGVMRSGRLEQIGSPLQIYSRPTTPFVAEFVGLMNRLQGRVGEGVVEVRGLRLPLVDQSANEGPATALVRPEALSLRAAPAEATGQLRGRVRSVSFLGPATRVTVDLGEESVVAHLPTAEASEVAAGQTVVVAIRPDPVLVQAPAGAAPAVP